MLIAKLVGSVWSTRKADSMRGLKLMLVELVGGTRSGEFFMAVDTIGAGVGDMVIVCTGSSASRMLDDSSIPVDAVIVGIIDEDCDLPVSGETRESN